MLSPNPTRGRRRLLEQIWQAITGILRPQYQGSNRSIARTFGHNKRALGYRDFDLEVSEVPVRDAVKARELIEIRDYCPEVGTAIDVIRGDVPSSSDGDDVGFGIPDDDRYENPVDARVLDIARSCADRVWRPSAVAMAVDRMVSYGDYFFELDIKLTGGREVSGGQFLPSWELFRVEENGCLLGYEQRRYLSERDCDYRFQPVKIVHGRFRRNNLYGRSLWNESLEDWAKLKDAVADLASASRQIGVNPTIHTMPEGQGNEYRNAYRDDHQAMMADGAISHYYFLQGHELRKLSETYPDLKALIETVMMWRSRLIMRSHVPPYLLGLPTQGAREIAGQPALAYARFINSIRQELSEGIRQTINTDLALKGIPKELWTYRITWPRIATNVFDERSTSNPNESEEIEDTERFVMVAPNGNGNGRII